MMLLDGDDESQIPKLSHMAGVGFWGTHLYMKGVCGNLARAKHQLRFEAHKMQNSGCLQC